MAYNTRLRNPKNEFNVTYTGTDRATNTYHLVWGKQRCRVTLIDAEDMATSATCRVSTTGNNMANALWMYFPLEGKIFANFSNIYHGQEIRREIWVEFNTGSSIHVHHISVEEWD